MIRALIGFELRYQLRRPLWWLITLVFFALAFGSGTSFVIELAGARGHVLRNAPVVTAQMLGSLSILALLLNTAFVAGAILRDFDCRCAELIFSRPLGRLDYLLGRFLGGLLVSSGAFMAAVAGLVLGTMMPWIDPQQLGPFLLSSYVWVVVVIVLPNLFLLATIFFCLAALSRSMLVTYLGAVASWAGFFLSFRMRTSMESRALAALIDPFGLGALREVTQYWTIVEKNTLLPALAGTLLHNRLLWLGVGLALLTVTLCCFRYRLAGGGRRRRPRTVESAGALGVAEATVALPRVEPVFHRATAWRQFLRQARVETLGVIAGTPFLVLLALGVYKLISVGRYTGAAYGTPTHPLTHLMIAGLGRTFGLLLLIIITFYAGELLWRERRLNLSEMFDAMPAPGWVFLGSKLTALMAAALVYLGVGVLTQISIQLYYGHVHLELGLYARGFVVQALPFLLASILALFLQVAAGNKFVGYLLMIPYLISGQVMGVLDFNHRLYDFGHTPAAPYSDLNGYGHFVAPLFWFNLYWAFGAAILALLALLLRIRGTDAGLKSRLRAFRRRFRRPQRLALAAAAAGFVATGGWIFYNTNVLNEYLPRDRFEARKADYEKKYRGYLELPQPRLTDVAVEVDLFPSERRFEARGRYLLVNRHDAPIRELHCTIPPEVRVNSLTLPAYDQVLHDPVHGYRIWRLERPLEPGEPMEMGFDLTVERRGFVAFDPNRSDTRIVHNGTSFSDSIYFPQFGYHPGLELQDPNLRRQYGLPPVHPIAAVDDLEARRNQLENRTADWIGFEATISTRADQIAVAPGTLEKEWTEGDRRYFHYRMDVPMLASYLIESAAYRVMRERLGEVAIEIYYHPSHTYNLERMMDAVRKTLAYCSEHFGPYQFRQLRILETPGYAAGAASFPNTIPYSETAGFIARVDGDRLDYPFYITAHEVAHQWWGHQVVPGNVQGARVLTETLAQYSALMVMEKQYGVDKMRDLLRYELDEYLFNRSLEKVGEVPLMVAERQKGVLYHKGAVVMYALRDYLGEQELNQALARFVAEVKFQPPPYPNTLELIAHLRQAAPPEKQSLITDFFETITFFENRVAQASSIRRADGKYQVTIATESHKLRADAMGAETEIALDDWIDVGVFGGRIVDGKLEETVLFLDKRRVTAPEMTFEVVVDERPMRAGIDPYHKLIDRNGHDNVAPVAKTVAPVARSSPAAVDAATAGG